MKALLVARDVAPSQALTEVMKELEKQGHEPLACLDFGKPSEIPLGTTARLVADSDIVLIGMSCTAERSAEEINVAQTAITQGIPLALYADTYNCHNRPWFKEVIPQASALFVINEEEAKKARETFPGLIVVASGNPMWEGFCFPKYSRAEVRKQLGIAEDEIFILAPGGKSATVNILFWGGILEALHNACLRDKKFQLVLALHPGDRNSEAIDPKDQKPLEVYADLVKYSPVPTRMLGKEIPTRLISDLIPGIDLLIESASTIGIEAAHQRKPVIDYFTEVALARMKEGTGSRDWDPCWLGVAKATYCVPDLATIIEQLLDDNHYTKTHQLERQQEIYPAPPKKGAAVKKIVETLVTIRG